MSHGFGVGVAPPEEPMGVEGGGGRSVAVPGCCVSVARSGLPLSPPGPSAGADSELRRLESPRHRTLRPSQSRTLGGGTGGWDVVLGCCRGWSKARDNRNGRAPAWGLQAKGPVHAALELLYAHVPPRSRGGSGVPRLQRPVPVPRVHGTALGNLLLVRSLFQAFQFPKCSIKQVLPRQSPCSPPVSRAGNPDLTSSARTIPMYNPNSLGC